MDTCWLPHAHLLHDPVDLAILCIDLIAHIQGHVTEVSNNTAHLLQVFIHFIFSGIICYPGSQRAIFKTESEGEKTKYPRPKTLGKNL